MALVKVNVGSNVCYELCRDVMLKGPSAIDDVAGQRKLKLYRKVMKGFQLHKRFPRAGLVERWRREIAAP